MGRARHRTDPLESVPLFSACSRRELKQLQSLLDEISVPEGKVLTREGETGREFFVVLEGRADVSRRGRRLATLKPGDFFGELSLIDQGPRTATVTAATAMTLYVMASREFSVLLDKHPGVARKVMRALAARLRESAPPAAH